MVRYRIDAAARHAHRYAVELEIADPAPEQIVRLPVWIPGSYLVREFARHLSHVEATQAGRAVAIEPLDKASWRVRAAPGVALVVRYRVYALDPSVRAAFLDADRGFFNATSLCLQVDGREHEPHALAVEGLPVDWSVATTLKRRAGEAKASVATTPAGAIEFLAASYDELADHPVEMGPFRCATFDAAGVRHELVVAHALPDLDLDRLAADSKRICEATIAFWHGDGRPPFDRYAFLLHATDELRSGLEHRSSTALVASRRDLPAQGARGETSDGYVNVLGLVSHEYFHAWNVKRLKPAAFATLDYARENYTELLWFFEGFTSYYDDLLLVRAGLIDAARYLKLVGKTMTAVAATPGRGVQSVAEASFDAWVKYYRPDENTPNATVSYYQKGSLVALAFDLALRGEGRGTLDDVMRRLWKATSGGPIDEGDIAAALEAVGGRSYAAELAAWVHGTAELPLDALLAEVGVRSTRQRSTFAQRLGVRASESALTGVKVAAVYSDGAAERAGLSAGDELVAAGDWRVRRLDDVARAFDADGRAELLVARDQRMVRLALSSASLGPLDDGAFELAVDDGADPAARRRFEAWLAG